MRRALEQRLRAELAWASLALLLVYYAFLKARMPQVSCSMFAPWVRLQAPLGGKDVMVVGKRRPFLSSTSDAEQLRGYERKFEDLVAKHT